MSRFVELLKSNQAYKELDDIYKYFIQIKKEIVEQNEKDEVVRIIKILQLAKGILKPKNADILDETSLQGLGSNFGHVKKAINNYNARKDLANLKLINSAISTHFLPRLITLTKCFPAEEREKDLLEEWAHENAAKLFDEYREVENISEELKSDLVNIKSELASLKNNYDEINEKYETILGEWQNRFTQDQNAKNEQLERQREKILETYKNNFDVTTREVSDKKDQILSDLKLTIEKEFEVIHAEIRDRLDKEKHDLEVNLKKSQETYESILNLHDLAADATVYGGYKKAYKEQQKAADLWRWFAVGSIVATVIWVICAIVFNVTVNKSGDVIWSKALLSFSLTLILLGGAGYAGKQSSLHRNSERTMRWFALETQAFGPFIEKLDESIQVELKRELAQRLFGINIETHGSSFERDGEVIHLDQLMKQLGPVLDLLKKYIPGK
ncbi:hypothetical protein [Magnetofaba australis]|uniref:Uncharacterized protein n=1 Tax=Magnetofaba australis IT-1 TaxID=1434232 RepID=A0A1Y2K0M9_9PROT|nr:hypothetical protein [Magnetofaba australis]OSM00354.1 hypothetical protein MAIT1_00854 [Magnetofaba australis IT-1]